VTCLDCEQSYIEFHGQCLKILRKATVGVETVNVSNSARVKTKISIFGKGVRLNCVTSNYCEGVSDG